MAPTSTAVFRAVADFASLNRSVKESRAEIEKLKRQAGKTDDFEKFDKQLGKVAESQKKLRAETKLLSAEQGKLGKTSGTTNLTNALEKLATANERVRTSTTGLTNAQSRQQGVLGQNKTSVAGLSSEMSKLARAEDAATKSAQNHAKSLAEERNSASQKTSVLSKLSDALHKNAQYDRDAAASADRHTEALNKGVAASESARSNHSQLGEATRESGRAANISAGEHDLLREALERLTPAAGQSGSNLRDHATNAREAGTAARGAADGHYSLATALRQITPAARDADSGARSASSSFRETSNAARSGDGDVRRFSDGLRQVSGSSREANTGSRALASTLSPLKSGFHELGVAGQGVRTMLLGIGFASVVPAIQLLLGSISALIGGLTALAGAVAPALGAIAALGPAAIAAAGAVGTIMSAFSGVGTALSAMNKLDTEGATASQANSKARIAAAKSVATAQRGVRDATEAQKDAEVSGARAIADAERTLSRARADAADAAAQAARRVSDAQADYVRASKRVADAEKDLHVARQQAIRDLEDLKEQVSDNALTQEGAEISLLRAQERQREVNADATASMLDRREAALNVAEAQERLSDISREYTRDTEDLNKAQKGGIDGMPAVVSAQDSLSSALEAQKSASQAVSDAMAAASKSQQDSAERISDAERNLSEAKEDSAKRQRDAAERVSDALERLADANNSAADSSGTVSAASKALAAAWAKLSPEGRKLVTLLHDMKPEFEALSRTAQTAMFPSLIKAIEMLRPMIKTVLEPSVKAFGTVIGGVSLRIANEVKSWENDLISFGTGDGPKFIEKFGIILVNLLGAMEDVGVAATPLLMWLTDLGVALSTYWAQDAAEGRRSGGLKTYFEDVRRILSLLGNIIYNVSGQLNSLFDAGAPYGEKMLRDFEALTRKTNEWMKTGEGKTALDDYFKKTTTNSELVLGLLADITGAFLRMGASDTLTTLLTSLRDDLGPKLAAFFDKLGASMKENGPAVIRLLGSILEMFTKLLGGPGGGFNGFIAVVQSFVDVLNKILDIPGFASLAGILMGIAGGLLAIKAVGKIGKGILSLPGIKQLNTYAAGVGGRGATGGAAGGGSGGGTSPVVPPRGGGSGGGGGGGSTPPVVPPRGGGGAPRSAATTSPQGFVNGLRGSSTPAATGTGRVGQAAGALVRRGGAAVASTAPGAAVAGAARAAVAAPGRVVSGAVQAYRGGPSPGYPTAPIVPTNAAQARATANNPAFRPGGAAAASTVSNRTALTPGQRAVRAAVNAGAAPAFRTPGATRSAGTPFAPAPLPPRPLPLQPAGGSRTSRIGAAAPAVLGAPPAASRLTPGSLAPPARVLTPGVPPRVSPAAAQAAAPPARTAAVPAPGALAPPRITGVADAARAQQAAALVPNRVGAAAATPRPSPAASRAAAPAATTGARPAVFGPAQRAAVARAQAPVQAASAAPRPSPAASAASRFGARTPAAPVVRPSPAATAARGVNLNHPNRGPQTLPAARASENAAAPRGRVQLRAGESVALNGPNAGRVVSPRQAEQESRSATGGRSSTPGASTASASRSVPFGFQGSRPLTPAAPIGGGTVAPGGGARVGGAAPVVPPRGGSTAGFRQPPAVSAFSGGTSPTRPSPGVLPTTPSRPTVIPGATAPKPASQPFGFGGGSSTKPVPVQIAPGSRPIPVAPTTGVSGAPARSAPAAAVAARAAQAAVAPGAAPAAAPRPVPAASAASAFANRPPAGSQTGAGTAPRPTPAPAAPAAPSRAANAARSVGRGGVAVGGVAAGIAGSIGGGMLGAQLGQKVGGNTGAMVGGIAGSIAGSMAPDALAAGFKKLGPAVSAAKAQIATLASSMGGVISAVGSAAAAYGRMAAQAVVAGAQSAAAFAGDKLKAIGGLVMDLGRAAAGFITMGIQAGISAARTLAVNAAALVVRGGMMAWAAAQWLLNAAMNANPIGLIILAITALVAALIYAWNNSETFRTIVIALWEGIKTAFSVAIDFIVAVWNGFWTGLQTVANAVFGAIVAWFTAQIAIFQAGWQMLVDAVTFLWNAFWTGLKIVASAVWNAIVAFFTSAWAIFQAAINALVNGIRALWQTFWTGIQTVAMTVWNAIKAFLDGAFAVLRSAWQGFIDTVNAIWTGFWGFIKDTASAAWKIVTDGVNAALDGVKTAFDSAVKWIGDMWTKIQQIVADPVNFVIREVYNNGIKAMWDKVAGWLNLDPLPTVNEIRIGQASGGAVPIMGDKRRGGHDRTNGGKIAGSVHGRDSVPILAQPGEYMLSARAVRNMGGTGVVDAMHRGAKRGAAGMLSKTERQLGGDKSSPGKGLTAEIRAGLFYGGVVSQIRQAMAAGGSVAAAQSFAQGEAGKPYVWGGVGPGGYDCSGFMSAITNVLTGSPVHSRRFATASFAGGPAGGFVSGLSSDFAIGVMQGNPGHMAGTLGGMNVESRGGQGVVVGGAARGADNSLFTQQFSLPQVGGAFASGGGGGGGVNPLLAIINAIIDAAVGVTKGAIDGTLGIMPDGAIKDMAIGVANKPLDGTADYLKAKASELFGAIMGGGGAAGGAVPTGDVATQVQAVAARYGWGSGAEWAALSNIISKESGWNPNAANPTSSARGLFQKMTSIHGAVEGSAAGQAEWGINYIKGRYGTPSKAWAYWQAHGNYATGGLVPGTGNQDTSPAMLTPGEFVLRKDAVKSIGLQNLMALNGMKGVGSKEANGVQRMADGGLVKHNGKDSYQVKKGDTLAAISRMFGVSSSDIMSLNKLKDASKIITGQWLTMPTKASASTSAVPADSVGRYKIQKGDTLTSLAKKYGVSVSELARINGISDPNKIYSGAWLSYPKKGVDSTKINPPSTTADTAPGADTSTAETLASYAAGIAANTKDVKEFEGNLLTLARWGYTNLASALQGMGVKAGSGDAGGGGLALSRQAVASPASAAAVEATLKDAQTVLGDSLGTVLKVVGTLAQTPGLGIREVSTKSEVDTSDMFKAFKKSTALDEVKKLPDANKSKFLANWEAYSKGLPFAYGGRVPGSGRGDTVPAMLTPGEFVLKKSAVDKIGMSTLNQLNQSGMPTQAFAAGGPVMDAASLFSMVASPSVSRLGLGKAVQDSIAAAVSSTGSLTNTSKQTVFNEGAVKIINPAPARSVDSFESTMQKLGWAGTFS